METMFKRISAGLVGGSLLFIACAAPAPGIKTSTDSVEPRGSARGGDDDSCSAGLEPTDPSTLPKCACKTGGSARCVKKDKIPSSFASRLDSCEDDGLCVPDTIVKSGGEAPKTCESIVGEGRCMSLCIPEVAEKDNLLDRGEGDVCDEGELCVPCVNPLEGGKSTGVCDIGKKKDDKACAKDPASKKDATPPAPSNDARGCPHQGPLIDTSTFDECGDGGRCVPESAVSPAQRSKLNTCPKGLCAPEKQVAHGGNYLPPTCASVGGAEGRCLSRVIKDIDAKADVLEQGTCDAGELCAPCFNPTDGSDTGACSTVSCDKPKDPPKTLTACCENKGRCVPESSVTDPDQKEKLGVKECVEGVELCAPIEDIARTTPRPKCTGVNPLKKTYEGACISKCLELGIKSLFVEQGSCDSEHVCAPCTALGKPTGACD